MFKLKHTTNITKSRNITVLIVSDLSNTCVWGGVLFVGLQRDREGDMPSAGSLPKWPLRLGLGQAKGKGLEFNQDLQTPVAAFPGTLAGSWIISRATGAGSRARAGMRTSRAAAYPAVTMPVLFLFASFCYVFCSCLFVYQWSCNIFTSIR